MLHALHLYQNFSKVRYQVHAFTVDLGYNNFDSALIADYCDTLNIPFTLIDTQIGKVVFDIRKESSPCALCAKLRKGALFSAIKQQGIDTCVFAHHREDCLESLLLSMLYEGRMRTFSPVTLLDRKGIRLIRPFIYLPEKVIQTAMIRHHVPVVKNPCPAADSTKRMEIKRLLAQICTSNPNAKEMMMCAISNVSQYSLWG